MTARTHATGTTAGAALARATTRLDGLSASPRVDADILLSHVLGKPRSWLMARPEAMLSDRQQEDYHALIEARATGVPVAYLTGYREFWSHSFRVTPATLIPRPETEHLIEAALERLPAHRACRIADLGTGSGIIALTLALARPDCGVIASDVSAAALAVAADNAARLAADNVEFRLGDWFAAIRGMRFDLIASNPPYIAGADTHLARGDLRHEPALALTPGPGGLEAIETLIAGASDHLEVGGWLIIEHGYDQGAAVRDLFTRHGYTDIAALDDLGGQPRVAAARLPVPETGA